MSKLTRIAEIEKSLEVRKKAKEYVDSCFTLSSEKENSFKLSSKGTCKENTPTRLLDEGAILYEGGEEIRLYIEKGCIQRFYDNLSDDFVGYINLGHIDIDSLPICLGTWTKEDLTVVDIGDGRKGLDCNVRLNDNLHIVQDLRNQEMPLSVSVEMTGEYDWEASYKFNAAFLQSINIGGFSVVGNPANVNSANANLSNAEGEKNMNFKELFGLSSEEKSEEKKEDKLENETPEQTENTEVSEELADVKTEETEEKLEDEKVEESTDVSVEETTDELANESTEDSTVTLSAEEIEMLSDIARSFKDVQAELESVKNENAELRAQLEEAKRENASQEKLKADANNVLKRLANLANLSINEEKLENKQPNKVENPWL